MPCVLLQRKNPRFQEETSDIEMQLLKLGFICEKDVTTEKLGAVECYRYSGKDKYEESGLYYHGARYYACWLGRWTASDPAGLVDGVNIYAYVNDNPVSGVDPSGTQTEDIDLGVIGEVEVKGEGALDERNEQKINDHQNELTKIEISDIEQKISNQINQIYDVSYSEFFLDNEVLALIQDFIQIFKKSNENADWLEKISTYKFRIEMINFPMVIKKNNEYIKTPRAATIYENGINIVKLNVGEQNYKKPSDYNDLKSSLLHELRHIWQLNNPEWKEKYAEKDIDIEVDAFEWQYKLERILGIKSSSQREKFESLTTKEDKAKYLWSHYGKRKDNQGNYMYTNAYGFKRDQ